ncbi:MAG: aspartate carbamoyltransferase catalytic subunit [Marinicaulis sp.]|nr:aspartate carbamoyltransferase catalytic subunit [Marinicaulis sp.]
MTELQKPLAPKNAFSANRLIGVDDLSDAEIYYLLDLAEYYAGFVDRSEPAPQILTGKTQINLFFEDSTRTNLSFELAGKKLGTDVINVPVAASSLHKGESLVDTARTLAAMGADVMVVRAKEEGLHEQLSKILDCAIVNGGAGALEHPTQALLDAATITMEVGPLKDKTIAICGDVKHSRVASSDAQLFTRLGATVRFVGPAALMPSSNEFPDVERFKSLATGLDNADIAMGLRMQFERMADTDKIREAAKDYFNEFGLTHETMKHAKSGAKVMHPGPMNRGVEICGNLADDRSVSLIEKQVFYGVAIRMAVLDALSAKE